MRFRFLVGLLLLVLLISSFASAQPKTRISVAVDVDMSESILPDFLKAKIRPMIADKIASIGFENPVLSGQEALDSLHQYGINDIVTVGPDPLVQYGRDNQLDFLIVVKLYTKDMTLTMRAVDIQKGKLLLESTKTAPQDNSGGFMSSVSATVDKVKQAIGFLDDLSSIAKLAYASQQ